MLRNGPKRVTQGIPSRNAEIEPRYYPHKMGSQHIQHFLEAKTNPQENIGCSILSLCSKAKQHHFFTTESTKAPVKFCLAHSIKNKMFCLGNILQIWTLHRNVHIWPLFKNCKAWQHQPLIFLTC